MFKFISTSLRLTIRLLAVIALILSWTSVSSAADREDLIKQSLTDIRVLYLFSELEQIDWPTVFYLNDKYGCRVDLTTIRDISRFEQTVEKIKDREIYLNRLSYNGSDSLWFIRSQSMVFADRRPDIIIFGDIAQAGQMTQFREHLLSLQPDDKLLFNPVKFYQWVSENSIDGEDRSPTVILNSRELYHQYEYRIANEVRDLLPWFKPMPVEGNRLSRYRLIRSDFYETQSEVDFLSGLSRLRLVGIIDSLYPAGPKKTVLQSQVAKFISGYSQSLMSSGVDQVDRVVDGFRELGYLYGQEIGKKLDSVSDLSVYLENLYTNAERAALRTVGLNWHGRIIKRDSPHGVRVKFRVSVSANSPLELNLSNVTFHRYWDSTTVLLDSVSRLIAPHQSFVREFLVDIDNQYLESQRPESLTLSADISYRGNSMTLVSSVPIWESPELNIELIPNFHFIPPVAELDIDRVVSAMSLKVVISKPADYSDSIRLALETPRGLFAGSYKSEHYLDKGSTRKIVRIPFSVSNLFEKGIQQQKISLYVDNQQVAIDTGRVRIASCNIKETVKVGFMPDSDGLLEDILRMTNADFEAVTDRTLTTYDLSAYNIIIVGSGSLENYPSFATIRDRIDEYLRQGGSILLLGQPSDWPDGILPIAYSPRTETVDNSEISNRISEARVLSQPYPISDKNLLSSFFRKQEVTSAVVSPAEVVYKTSSGGSLLSVSRLGDGQIIYCGLPLLEMISRLDIDAIHLFANIVNY